MKLERKHICPLTLAPLLVALGFVLFKLFTASKITNPETGRTSRISLTPEQENRLGLEAYAQVQKDEASKIISHGADVDLVKRVTAKLARSAAEKSVIQYQWDVSLTRTNNKFVTHEVNMIFLSR